MNNENQNNISLLITRLLEATRGNQLYRFRGLCCIIKITLVNKSDVEFWLNEMDSIVKDLGFYSGDRLFPINPPAGYFNKECFFKDAILAYYNSDSLWDRSDPYCKRRIQVAKILIERLANS